MKDRLDEDEATSSNIPETTGKFGTGFITTHLLSKIINVSGVYFNKDLLTFQKFEFCLDWNAKNKTEMIKKYDSIFLIFDKLDDHNICPVI